MLPLRQTTIYICAIYSLWGGALMWIAAASMCQWCLLWLYLCADQDFEPVEQDSSDDEETIEKDEREHKNVRFTFTEFVLTLRLKKQKI